MLEKKPSIGYCATITNNNIESRVIITMKHVQKFTNIIKKEDGNATLIGLIVLAVIAIGALAYFSSQISDDQTNSVSASQTDMAENENNAEETQEEAFEIKPGNPVVATINKENITRNDVIEYIKTMPMQMQQMPAQQLFPAALNQIVNEELVRQEAATVNLDNNPIVKRRLESAKKEIVATVFLQNAIEENVTDEAMQKAYEAYVAELPEVEEANASHILVESKDEAIAIIQQLEEGADFAELAKEKSIDKGSAIRGGNLGYFTREDVVPEFAEIAFTQELGTHSFEPVESDFGYHIIQVEERRVRPTPTLEEATPMIQGIVRQQALAELFSEWRDENNVEMFDINGESLPKDIAPANGEEKPAAE